MFKIGDRVGFKADIELGYFFPQFIIRIIDDLATSNRLYTIEGYCYGARTVDIVKEDDIYLLENR